MVTGDIGAKKVAVPSRTEDKPTPVGTFGNLIGGQLVVFSHKQFEHVRRKVETC